MGKIAREKRVRHDPLEKSLHNADGKLSLNKYRDASQEDLADERSGYLDAATSRKILELAKEQQLEEDMAEEQDRTRLRWGGEEPDFGTSEDDAEEFDTLEVSEVEEISDAEEENVVSDYFSSSNSGGSFNLADKILAKIEEKDRGSSPATFVNDPEYNAVSLPPKVIEAYEKIGTILATYTHGKLPKLFKVLPTLKNWEDVLFVTNPDAWSPHATFEATKLFVSNLQAHEAQVFIEKVLLEKFRTSIADSEDHTLDHHLYRAIKKSLYKPGAFFKGFLIPLVDQHCSVREAMILSSILKKVSVPVLHSSVALVQLALRQYNPSTTVFIRTLIEKRYALPYQTLDQLVFYFMNFRHTIPGNDSNYDLPVVWHKAFYAFAQRYKNDITEDQRDFLIETVRQHFHHAIGPEIRRELLAGTARAS